MIHGIRSYTGSATMLYYQEATSNVRRIISPSFWGKNTRTDYTLANFGQNTEPEEAALKLRLNDGGAVKEINCICFITSFSISCSVGEVVSAEINFEGTGLPTNMNMIT